MATAATGTESEVAAANGAVTGGDRGRRITGRAGDATTKATPIPPVETTARGNERTGTVRDGTTANGTGIGVRDVAMTIDPRAETVTCLTTEEEEEVVVVVAGTGETEVIGATEADGKIATSSRPRHAVRRQAATVPHPRRGNRHPI